jgi:glycosyltransferase involved in cell wall biosynthesis
VAPLYFNGKFYAGGLNGVHRVADRLIRECDALLHAREPADRPRARLLVPRSRRWQPQLQAIELVEEANGGNQMWEQAVLPRRAADGVLVNLANLAPIAHRRKILLLHDAQFLFPDSSYPARQRIGYRLLTPRMAATSATVLTVSDYSRQMLDLFGVSARSRTRVLYNGADHIHDQPADPTILERLGLAPQAYVLLFGSHKAYKNNAVVLDAFAEGSLDPLRLVVVGDENALRKAALAVPTGTVFTGKVGDAELRALYAAAHCLVFPSRTEGFGLPPVEAMLCDCPVVIAPAGALPEVCGDAVLYAGVDDVAGWREAIALLRDPALRHAKVAAGRRRAARFTWRRAGQALLDVATAA